MTRGETVYTGRLATPLLRPWQLALPECAPGCLDGSLGALPMFHITPKKFALFGSLFAHIYVFVTLSGV